MRLATVLLSLAFAGPAAAQDCTPLARERANMERAGVAYDILTGDRALRASGFYNATPPATPGVNWSVTLVALLPDASGVLLVGLNGAVCDRLALPPPQFRALMSILYGGRV